MPEVLSENAQRVAKLLKIVEDVHNYTSVYERAPEAVAQAPRRISRVPAKRGVRHGSAQGLSVLTRYYGL